MASGAADLSENGLMRIGIISDTHDRLARTSSAIQMLANEGAEAIIHCGDLTGPEVVQACAVLPGYYVFGNNDFDSQPELRRAIADVGGTCLEWGGEVQLVGKRLAVTHGHLRTEVRSLLSSCPDYFFHGHSHMAADFRRDGPTRCINPGALHRARRYSVALLDLQTDVLKFIPVPP